MHAILITLGSFGDVQPFVGLGTRLRDRGHDVLLVTNEYFRPMVEQAGLAFAPLSTIDVYRELLDCPDMWHPTRGFRVVFQRGVASTVKPMYELIMQRYVPGKTLVVGSTLALGARVAQDRHGIPTATIHLSPAIIRSFERPPRLPGAILPRGAPTFLRKAMWALADRLIIDPIAAPAVNELRRELGLPRVRSLLDQWIHSPDLTIGLFPDWFAPPASDWPRQVRLTGFPLFDRIGLEPTPPDLLHFLDDGPPPIVFTAGSAMAHGQAFFQSAVEICRLLDRRGLLLARYDQQIPRDLPATVRHVAYAPFSDLLPRCCAIVHHGGIGTTSQALRAGIPQLLVPMSHDQLDNAQRVKDLGVGDAIASSRFNAKRAAKLLRALLDSADTQARCRQIAQRFTNTDPLAETCTLLEQCHAACSA